MIDITFECQFFSVLSVVEKDDSIWDPPTNAADPATKFDDRTT